MYPQPHQAHSGPACCPDVTAGRAAGHSGCSVRPSACTFPDLPSTPPRSLQLVQEHCLPTAGMLTSHPSNGDGGSGVHRGPWAGAEDKASQARSAAPGGKQDDSISCRGTCCPAPHSGCSTYDPASCSCAQQMMWLTHPSTGCLHRKLRWRSAQPSPGCGM